MYIDKKRHTVCGADVQNRKVTALCSQKYLGFIRFLYFPPLVFPFLSQFGITKCTLNALQSMSHC